MIKTIDYWLLGSYLALIVLIALFSAKDEKKSLDNFFLASRKLTIPALVATLTTTWYGNILGSSELAFNSGLANLLVQGAFWYVAALLFMVFLAPKINVQNLYTFPSLIASRFDNKAGILAAVINLIMNNAAPYILSLGLIVCFFFPISRDFGILAAAAFPMLYTLRGSFQTVILTDIVQFFFMYLGPAMLLTYLFQEFGGIEFLEAKLDPTLLQINGNLSQAEIIAWSLLALWTLVDPNFYQRALSAVNAKSLRWSIFISVIFWFIFDIMITALALYAKALQPMSDPKFALVDLAQNYLPEGALAIFLLAILSILMSTIDSLIFTSGSIFAFDIYLRIKNSVFKSSSVQLRSDAPKVSLTIQKSYQNRHRTELLVTSRIGIVIFTVLAAYIALRSASIIGLLYLLGSLGVGTLLIPSLIALFIKRTWYHSRVAAFYIMSCSFLSSAFWVYYNEVQLGLDGYLYDIEPIFVGLSLSFVLFVLDMLRVRLSLGK